MKYCLDCEWSVHDGGARSGPDSSQRAIDHVAETGHSISSDDSPTLPPIRLDLGPGLASALRVLTLIEDPRREP